VYNDNENVTIYMRSKTANVVSPSHFTLLARFCTEESLPEQQFSVASPASLNYLQTLQSPKARLETLEESLNRRILHANLTDGQKGLKGSRGYKMDSQT
jgi:hypothetical protein